MWSRGEGEEGGGGGESREQERQERRKQEAGSGKRLPAPGDEALTPEVVHYFLLPASCFLLSPFSPSPCALANGP